MEYSPLHDMNHHIHKINIFRLISIQKEIEIIKNILQQQVKNKLFWNRRTILYSFVSTSAPSEYSNLAPFSWKKSM